MALQVSEEYVHEEESAVKKSHSKGPAGVSFQPKLSVLSISGTESVFDTTDFEEGEERPLKQRRWWISLAENIYFKMLFRTISAINLVILALSIPFFSLSTLKDNESEEVVVSIQFKVITGLDFILACAYTFYFILNISYTCYKGKTEKKSKSPSEDEKHQSQTYHNCFRHFRFLLLTLTMWYSVAIGIYRSINPVIYWAWYLGFTPRAVLAVFPVINLSLKVESSAVQKLFRAFKWKQLAMVTLFYFIFVFIFALIGVHSIGVMDYACVYKTLEEDGNYSMVPALPLTHCSPKEDRLMFCARDGENISGLVCAKFPDRKDEHNLFFNYRSSVYYGQFRDILSSLYAVYEASTLELWSFMMYNAIESRGVVLPVLFYFFLVFFVVVILQQSLFLVVIIESFADLRDKSFFWKSKSSSQKTRSKPNTVLSLQDSATNNLQLQLLKNDGSKAFIDKHSRFLVNFEKVFLVLVIVDAIVAATKHTEMDYYIQELLLQIWQVTVSVLFVIEIVFLFFFHLYHGQWKLFLRRPYYLCLVVLAVGGLVAALPFKGFYDPLLPGNGLVIFQALRFPRLLRLSQTILDFTLKIVCKSIPILSVITIIIICWLAVFNAQIFGYITDYPEECSRVSGEQFSTLPDAFLSSFQLVMNEAWTDVTSEVMCRSVLWFLTNFYFIFIHLFSSLIFLNFFGAVILDNLEYDEEEKKAKLEEIKKKEAETNEIVPLHLKIFEKLGNKPKKLVGIGGEVTNLHEVDVRKFFDSANNSALSDDPMSYTHEFVASLPSDNYRKPSLIQDSQLHQLSLVSSGEQDLMQSEARELHKKYASISAILNYIILWRKYNEEIKCKDVRRYHMHYIFGESSHDRKTSKLSSNNAQSEYEVFKERHRFFDMSLFCMPPEHKLRKFCRLLLTAQMNAPRYVLIEGKGEIFQLFKKRLSFILRWIISRLPYSEWVMFFVLWFIVMIQLYDFSIDKIHPRHIYTFFFEAVYLFLMLSWLILKVISHGCFLNPHAAISSPWDLVDWILVLHSTVLLALLPVWFDGDFHWLYVEINIPFLPYWAQYFFIIRSLRPLHIVSLLSSLRAGVREIVEGWRNLLKAVVIMLGFMFLFASLGVQLFAGTKENPLAFCNDPRVKLKNECVGEFRIRIESSREFLPLNDSTFPVTEILVPRVWFPNARDFPFNNVATAFVTLFELLTLEGWTEVRDMFSDRNSKAEAYMQLYIHTFVFFAVNIGLQLFLGIVINNFNEHKPGHTFLLSAEQNRWADLMQRVSLQRPDKLPLEPRGKNNKMRLFLYNCLTHNKYKFIPTTIIALSTLTLVVPWEEDEITSRGVQTLISLSIILNLFTVVEMFVKLLAFGSAYFHSWRNTFDFLLSLCTFAYTIFGTTVLISPFPGHHRAVSYFALTLAVTKLLTVMVKYSALLNLLLTVFSTLFASVPLVLLILIFSLCYALLGVTVFGNVRSGEAIDYRLVNFRGTSTALSAVWRSITGEDWYQIMWDTAVHPPYCQDSLKDCGNQFVAFLYFGSLTFILSFILLNVFIAVLLENFSIFYSDEETNLDLIAMKDFKRKWRRFDLTARGHIPISRVKLLLRSLDLQSYYTYDQEELPGSQRERVIHDLTEDSMLLWEMEKELEQEALSSSSRTTSTDDLTHHLQRDSPDHSSINVEFLNVLRMLAYRCEDIYKRLEPQELFQRKELEETVQFDVAENCIMKWMNKRVKPYTQWLKAQEHSSPNEESQSRLRPVVSIKEKRQQLFSLHNAQSKFLTVQGWDKQSSMDTEDEGDRDSWILQLPSDNQVELHFKQEANNASQSLNRLKKKYTTTKSHNDAKEWFHMQNRWIENIETNPNYFDDCL